MNLIPLRKYDNTFTANIMLSRLQGAGILCYLRDDNVMIVTRPIGGIKLMVRDVDEDEARKVIEQFEAEYKTYLTCPNCGSNNIYLASPEGVGGSITGILSFYFAEQTSGTEDMYKCNECGHETLIPAGSSPEDIDQ